MEFNNNQFITINNVIEKLRLTYGECSTLQLLNEHGRELNLQEIVENAGVDTLKRRPSSSPPPTPPNTPPQLNTHKYLSIHQ